MTQFYVLHPIYNLVSTIFANLKATYSRPEVLTPSARLSMVYVDASRVRLKLEQDIRESREQYQVLSYHDTQSLAEIEAELCIDVLQPLLFEVSHPGDTTLHSNLWGEPNYLKDKGRYMITISGLYGLHLNVAIRKC